MLSKCKTLVGDQNKQPEVIMGTLLADVSDFLATAPMKLFIGGQWVDAARKGRFETRDPGSGKVLAEV